MLVGDPGLVPSVAGIRLACELDTRSIALLRLGALVTASEAQPLVRQCVGDALDSGLTADEIVAALIGLAPTIGIARVTSAAPNVAAALGYDVDAELERFDEPGQRQGGL